MRWALLTQGVVDLIVEQDTQPDVFGEWVLCPSAGPGWVYVDGEFTQQQTAQVALTVADFDAGLMRHFDAVAQSKHYDNRITCALRAGYAGPFQSEGTAFAQWMDDCNVFAYTALAAWQAGERAAPASVDAFIAELPTITWPA